MKRKILAIAAIAGVSLTLAATPASAYQSGWLSTKDAYIEVDCGAINHGHTSTKAYISSGCDWNFGIRAQYNEFGANYTTAWAWGRKSSAVFRDRIFLHQIQY